MSDEEDEMPIKKAKSTTRISSSILQLKFMRPTFNELEKEKKKTESKKPGAKRIYPTVLKPEDDPIVDLNGVTREDRFTKLEELNFGRFSFRGQNPEVEKLMAAREERRGCRKRKVVPTIKTEPQE